MRKLRALHRVDEGLTLIELMLVVLVIGVLAGVIAVNLNGVVANAKINSMKGTLTSLQTAVDTFAANKDGKFPTASGGAGALLVALDRVVGDNSTDPIVAIAIGAREGLFLLLRVQDAGLRAWTGLAPVEVLARMGAVDGPRSLAVFTQLVGAHLASQAQVPAETFRSAFAIAVAVIAALAVGLSPLRGLRAARRTARESAQRLARYDARESDA